MRRHLTAGLAAVCLAVGAAFAIAPTASAGPLDATCTGTVAVDYSPGLTLTAQTVTASATSTYPSCLTSQTGVTSASASGSVTDTLDCNSLLTTTTGVKTYHWNDGTTSRFEYTRTGTRVLSQTVVTFTGTITSGKFSGDTAVETNIAANLGLLDCLAPGGVTHVDFTALVELT
ncbi:hypothetical protein ACFT5B_10490 [Luteimicrobium sp. NPDC057192]|uniref:hypothetical protein n=1 Tax=Luteimicrobium sp. NPDC057192 TaxID=3346042 RepID=UPI0036413377